MTPHEPPVTIPPEELAGQLNSVDQGHLLQHWDHLDEQQQKHLVDEIKGLALDELHTTFDAVLQHKDVISKGEWAPPSTIPLAENAEQKERNVHASDAGKQLLSEGKVGAFLVAGGQGTRLGFDGPKGMYPIGPVTGRTLFAYHAQRVLATCRRYQTQLPLYVMTSRANHQETQTYFEESGHFGLDPDQVLFLPQGMLPAIDHQGRILMQSKYEIALSPDGHGGCFTAMEKGGAFEHMRACGVEHIFYFQVDNPLAPVFDPVFLGHHVLGQSDLSTKVVSKSSPSEKVGLLVHIDDKLSMVEYSDLDPAVASLTDEQGQLVYRAGNIAMHAIATPFAQRMAEDPTLLPLHRANKRVPSVNAAGELVTPTEPNAVKMERFVFDALPHAERAVVQEVRREDEFAPVKNDTGNDSPESCHQLMQQQAARWHAAAGREAPTETVEIGPLFAMDQEQFVANLTEGEQGPLFDQD